MKHLKKALALLLCLALTFCFAACGKSGDKEQNDGVSYDPLNPTVTGKWSTKIESSYFMKDYIEQAGMTELKDKPLYAYYYLQLNENGVYSFTIDKEKTAKEVKEYLNAMVDPMLNKIYETYAAQGISKSEADAQFKKQTGKSIKEYVQNMINTLVSPQDMFEGTDLTGVYVVEDGKLYMAENDDLLMLKEHYFEYTLDGRKLTLTAFYGNPLELEETNGFELFPWEFTR